MKKRTLLDRLEIQADGTVFIRLLKQIVDGEMVEKSEPHRSVIYPSTSVTDQITAVNAHLAQMGWPGIPADGVERIVSHVKVVHTPEIIAAWEAAMAAQQT
jgi:hypothetical protein